MSNKKLWINFTISLGLVEDKKLLYYVFLLFYYYYFYFIIFFYIIFVYYFFILFTDKVTKIVKTTFSVKYSKIFVKNFKIRVKNSKKTKFFLPKCFFSQIWTYNFLYLSEFEIWKKGTKVAEIRGHRTKGLFEFWGNRKVCRQKSKLHTKIFWETKIYVIFF